MVWLQNLGLYFSQPLNNFCFMLVVMAWIDAMEFSSGSGSGGIFKSRTLQRFFMCTNTFGVLFARPIPNN